MKRFALAIDLVEDARLIAEYEEYHKTVWPDIINSIHDSGIKWMEIYRAGNRLFMVMETIDGFSFEKKAAMDAANPKVKEWEQLMWKYQRAIPAANPGEKWVLMDKIFSTSIE